MVGEVARGVVGSRRNVELTLTAVLGWLIYKDSEPGRDASIA